MEIRSLEIDFDNNILKINGEQIKTVPVIVTLPGEYRKYPISKLFNAELSTGNREECDRIEIDYKSTVNNKPL